MSVLEYSNLNLKPNSVLLPGQTRNGSNTTTFSASALTQEVAGVDMTGLPDGCYVCQAIMVAQSTAGTELRKAWSVNNAFKIVAGALTLADPASDGGLVQILGGTGTEAVPVPLPEEPILDANLNRIRLLFKPEPDTAGVATSHWQITYAGTGSL